MSFHSTFEFKFNRRLGEVTVSFWAIFLCAVLLVIAGCGKQDDESFGGGIGGTGTGTIDSIKIKGPNQSNESGPIQEDPPDFEVVVNQTRHFLVTPETEILLDGQPIEVTDLESRGVGWVANVMVGDDANATMTRGSALKIHIRHHLIGPVTKPFPDLEVLGQTVATGPGTNFHGFSNRPNPQAGDVILVSGYAGQGNHIYATRLENGFALETHWKITGPVHEVVPGKNLSVGQLRVAIGRAVIDECEGGPQPGDWIRARITPPSEFNGDVLTLEATRVRCIRQGLEVSEDFEKVLVPAEIAGLVHSASLPMFVLGGQKVSVSEETAYQGGRPNQVVEGAYLRVSGVFQLSTKTLHALNIRFLNFP